VIGAVVVNVIAGALWDRGPLEPVKTIELVPVGVDVGTVMVNCAVDPAETVNGNEGVVVAPEGSPEMAIDTLPVKPLMALIETVIGMLVPPCTTLTAPLVEIEKSGGCCGEVEVLPPAPHPPDPKARMIAPNARQHCRLPGSARSFALHILIDASV
jgi:hypothetical protein